MWTLFIHDDTGDIDAENVLNPRKYATYDTCKYVCIVGHKPIKSGTMLACAKAFRLLLSVSGENSSVQNSTQAHGVVLEYSRAMTGQWCGLDIPLHDGEGLTYNH